LEVESAENILKAGMHSDAIRVDVFEVGTAANILKTKALYGAF